MHRSETRERHPASRREHSLRRRANRSTPWTRHWGQSRKRPDRRPPRRPARRASERARSRHGSCLYCPSTAVRARGRDNPPAMSTDAAPRLEFAPGLTVRGLRPPLRLADFRLIAFDMDSTLINIECVDEIAAAAGRKAEVAAITEAAMRGEIADYKESLRQRVALLAGVPVEALERVWQERLRLNPGAEFLVHACQAAGLKTLLVSGGFTYFTDKIRERLALDYARSN